ncbi:MAG: hypothetical protein NC191_07120 [Muribaculaceae bacterium]|nr:hypothetical protein [Muribaculaceae bacterium]
MRIEKLTQYNINNDQTARNRNLKNNTVNYYGMKNQSPSFTGRNIFQWLYKLLTGEDDFVEPSSRPRRRVNPPISARNERPWESTRKRQQVERPKRNEVIKTPPKEPVIEEPKIKKPTVEVQKPKAEPPNRYALIDEYERITQARAAFKKRTAGRSLTPEEKIESEHLRQAWSEVYHSLVPEHQSIIRTKTAAEFSSNAERKDYIMKYVLPRMNVSEESALDGLDMFEQFGFRAEYPNGINTTITKLAENMYTLPKESKSDKVLNRFIDVFGKFGNNVPSKHPDDEELCFVLTDFAAKGLDIKEETFLRGIHLLEKIACQKWCAESLDDALISSYDAKFKKSQSLIDALNELKLAVKDLKYRLGADDRC